MSSHPFRDTYVVCTRRVRRGRFESEPGATMYLRVPDGRNPSPGDRISQRDWFEEVRDRADGEADNRIDPAGDVLVFIHGYNNDQDIVMDRHRQLQSDLWQEGFRGLVVSFDWPSASSTVNYLEDRWDASETAIELVTDVRCPWPRDRDRDARPMYTFSGTRPARTSSAKRSIMRARRVSFTGATGGSPRSCSWAATSRATRSPGMMQFPARCLDGRSGSPTTRTGTTRF